MISLFLIPISRIAAKRLRTTAGWGGCPKNNDPRVKRSSTTMQGWIWLFVYVFSLLVVQKLKKRAPTTMTKIHGKVSGSIKESNG